MHKGLSSFWLTMTLVLSLSSTLGKAQAQQGLLTELRAFTPQWLIDEARRIGDGKGNPRRIDVEFTRADLDGTGQFNFVVAVYNMGIRGTMSLFRLTGTQLQQVANVDRTINVAGSNLSIELPDINNDGRPAILVRGYGAGTHFSLLIFAWNGKSLRLLTPVDVDTSDANLQDVKGDGKLELVTPPNCVGAGTPESPADCEGGFKVYQLDPVLGQFKLAFTSPTDPGNPTAGTSQAEEVFAFRTILTPRRFELDQVLRPTHGLSREEGVVTVRLGNLRAITPGKLFSQVDVSDVDASTLVLGRNIKVLRTQFRNPEEDDEAEGHQVHPGTPSQGVPPKGRFIGVFLEAKFSREALLAYLPKTQPDKPLQPGDVLTVDLTGKMRNGAPLHASVAVLIKGEH